MSHNFIIVNGDTDSIAFKKPDEKPFTPEEQSALLTEINALMPHGIVWKNDKHYRRIIVVAAKNYVMDDGKKIKLKGDSLKATKKAPALRAFIREVIDLLLRDKVDQVFFTYLRLAKEVLDLKEPWCFKATVTKKVLEPGPDNVFQQKILTAIGKTSVSEGDKVYLFYKGDGSLGLKEDFNGDFDRMKLMDALKASVKVFKNVFDADLFPKFSLKRNQNILAMLDLDRTLPAPEPKKVKTPKSKLHVPEGVTPVKLTVETPEFKPRTTIMPMPGIKMTRV